MSADHFRCEGPPRRSYPVLRHRYNPLVDSPEQDGLPEAMVSTRRLAAIVAPMSRDLRAPPYRCCGHHGVLAKLVAYLPIEACAFPRGISFASSG